MGQLACSSIEADPELILAGKGGRQDDLAECIRATQAEVVLDLTTASAVYRNAQTIIEAGVHPVIGTTGLLPEQIEVLQRQCEAKKLGGLIVPNFSLGMMLLMQFAEEAAKYFPYVEIIETHHEKKEESPSGTAVFTAQRLAEVRKEKSFEKGREVLQGARGAVFKRHTYPFPTPSWSACAARKWFLGGSVKPCGSNITARAASVSRLVWCGRAKK